MEVKIHVAKQDRWAKNFRSRGKTVNSTAHQIGVQFREVDTSIGKRKFLLIIGQGSRLGNNTGERGGEITEYHEQVVIRLDPADLEKIFNEALAKGIIAVKGWRDSR
jgi:hypothetical protein